MRKTTTTHITANLSGGFNSPLFNLQFTPLYWGIGVYCSVKNKRIVSVSFKLGPFSFAGYFYSFSFHSSRECSKTASHTFEKVK